MYQSNRTDAIFSSQKNLNHDSVSLNNTCLLHSINVQKMLHEAK